VGYPVSKEPRSAKTSALKFGFGGVQDKYATPSDIYASLDKVHGFDFDPCPLNPTEDTLLEEWGSSNFVNPPYSDKQAFLEKAVKEMLLEQRASVFLIPFNPSTNYWFRLVWPFAERIQVFKGRLSFHDVTQDKTKKSCPFQSCIVVFNYKHWKEVRLVKSGFSLPLPILPSQLDGFITAYADHHEQRLDSIGNHAVETLFLE
jgi:hypothetical protein